MKRKEVSFRKTLVLNVDRDGDVERKTGLKTPVIGRKKALEIANKLLLADPEEADGNAIFAAVKVFDEIEGKEGREKQIAVVSGLESSGIKADRKIITELTKVLKEFPADNIVLVTDGYADEQIIPIVSSFAPISSIQRIIVKHSKSVEETYALLAKYLKMIWRQPPYRLYFVGVPGLALLLIGILNAFGLLQLAGEVLLILLGSVFIVRGFGLDEYVAAIKRAPPIDLLKLFSIATSVTILIAGTYLSYIGVSELPEFAQVCLEPQTFFTYGGLIVGVFLRGFVPVLTVVILVYVFGMTLYNIFTETGNLFKNLLLVVSSFVLYFIGGEVAEILIDPSKGVSTLILYIIIGVSVIFITSVSGYILMRKRE